MLKEFDIYGSFLLVGWKFIIISLERYCLFWILTTFHRKVCYALRYLTGNISLWSSFFNLIDRFGLFKKMLKEGFSCCLTFLRYLRHRSIFIWKIWIFEMMSWWVEKILGIFIRACFIWYKIQEFCFLHSALSFAINQPFAPNFLLHIN